MGLAMKPSPKGSSEAGSGWRFDRLGPLWRLPWLPVVAPFLSLWEAVLGRRILAPGDGFKQYLPWFVTSAKAWRGGHLPTWNPYAFSGYPLMAMHQPGALYPPNLLFLAIPPVLAYNLTIILSIVLAGVGAWLLVRHLTNDGLAATVAGVAFAFCGFIWGHIGHASMIATAAWLPWMLFGFELLKQRLTPGRLLLASSAVALSVLAGHSQILFQNLLALAIYGGVSSILESRGKRMRALGCLALAGSLGLALSMVQLLPTAVAVLDGTERTHVSYDFVMEYSFPKSHGALLFFPFLFGNSAAIAPYASGYVGQWNLTELAGYPGMAAAVLAAAGIGGWRRDRRVIALIALGAVALAMAFGPSTPLSKLMFHVPIYGQLRAWGRYIVIFDLAIAALAGYGAVLLRRAEGPVRKWALVRSSSLVLLIGALALIALQLDELRVRIPSDKILLSLAVPLAAALLCFALIWFLKRNSSLPAMTLVILLVLDGFLAFGAFYEWRVGKPTVADIERILNHNAPFEWGKVADAPGGIERYAFIGDVWMSEFVHASDLKGTRSINGNDPLAPSHYLEALQMNHGGTFFTAEHLWYPDSRVMDLLRVTTIISPPPGESYAYPEGSLLSNGETILGGRFVRYEYGPRLPEAYLVGSTERGSRDHALAAIYGGSSFDPRSLALIEGPCDGCPTGTPGSAGEVLTTRWGPNWTAVELSASRRALLVVSQAWAPGWHAWIDGSPAEVLRTNGVVQGVAVPAGRHEVTLRYRAPGLRLGFIVSLLTLIGLISTMAFLRVRTWRRQKT